MTADLPAGVRALLNKCAPGWRYTVTHAVGPCEFGALSAETRGDGTRAKITVVEQVESIGVRLCHRDGRAAVALWVRRPGYVGDGKLGVRWWKPTKVKAGTRPPLLLLLDPAQAALLSVLLRWRRRPYEPDMAWRGRHADEHTPRKLSITDLGRYVVEQPAASDAA